MDVKNPEIDMNYLIKNLPETMCAILLCVIIIFIIVLSVGIFISNKK